MIAIWIGFFQIFVFAGYSLIALFIFIYVKKTLICLDGLRNDPDINVAGDHLHGTDLFVKKRKMLTRFKIDMIFFCVTQIIVNSLLFLLLSNRHLNYFPPRSLVLKAWYFMMLFGSLRFYSSYVM